MTRSDGNGPVQMTVPVIQAGLRVKITVTLLDGATVNLECEGQPQVIPGVVIFPVRAGRAECFSLTAIRGWQQKVSEIAIGRGQ